MILEQQIKKKKLAMTFKESFKLNDKVRIVGGPKDVQGKTGHIGEIRNGLHAMAPKTYTIDYDVGERTISVQLQAKDIRALKESISFKQFYKESK